MIKVISADDHALTRKGIKHILDKTKDIRVVEEAENGRQLLSKLSVGNFDVVALDLFMPGMEAFEVIRKVKETAPHLKILVISAHPDKQFGMQALKAGVDGYLNKSSDLNELVTAIRQVYGGRRFISSALAEKLAERLADDDEPPHEKLSEREFQVMRLLASAKTVTETAVVLNLSVKTVSTYRKRVLEKMDMENNAQLTYYAIQNRLV